MSDIPAPRELTTTNSGSPSSATSRSCTGRWSGFSNFAISFSIISILAGCFTTFGAGWNNGGPIAISLGLADHLGVHPDHRPVHVRAGLGLSRRPAASTGGRRKLGGAKAGYYTGWLNLIGLLAIDGLGRLRLRDLLRPHARHATARRWAATATPRRACSSSSWSSWSWSRWSTSSASHLLAIINNVSVWWHVVGAAIVVADPGLRARPPPDVSYVFTDTVNNTGFFGGDDQRAGLLVLRPAARLPAHPVHDHRLRRLRAPVGGDPERGQRAPPRASGARSSTRPSAAGSCCSSFLFAVQDLDGVNRRPRRVGGGRRSHLRPGAASRTGRAVVCSSRPSGQFFCTIACMTSTSRMLFAFSRDGAVPGRADWSQAERATDAASTRVIVGAVVARRPHPAGAVRGQHRTARPSGGLLRGRLHRRHRPVRRLRDPDLVPLAAGRLLHRRGRGTLGTEVQVDGTVAVAEIVDHVRLLPAAVTPGRRGRGERDDFAWKFVNYTPIVVLGALLALWIGWHVSAKNWFTGPKRPSTCPPGSPAPTRSRLEHRHEGYLTRRARPPLTPPAIGACARACSSLMPIRLE